jgi:hypothetical protein
MYGNQVSKHEIVLIALVSASKYPSSSPPP